MFTFCSPNMSCAWESGRCHFLNTAGFRKTPNGFCWSTTLICQLICGYQDCMKATVCVVNIWIFEVSDYDDMWHVQLDWRLICKGRCCSSLVINLLILKKTTQIITEIHGLCQHAKPILIVNSTKTIEHLSDNFEKE